MEKGDLIKIFISILFIVFLAFLVVNANKLIKSNLPEIAEKQDIGSTGESVVDYGDCFSEDPSTVVFVHSNSCPHCNSMKPIIGELEEEGYKFYWAESSDSAARQVVNDCFSDILGGYVPQFICPKTGKEKTGGMSKAELKSFADSCI